MLGPTSLTGIDTNVILRALLHDDPQQSPVAARLIRSFTTQDPGLVTQITLAEIYWTLGRAYQMTKADRLEAIRRIVESRTLEFDDGESVVRALSLADEGADFADALIQGRMERFGASETVTFDPRAADRLGWRLLDA